MNQEELFLYTIMVFVSVSVFIAIVMFAKKIINRKSTPYNYQDTHKFKYHKQEAHLSITSGIDGISKATNLFSINENLAKAHSGLDFFDHHGVEFASKTPQEIRDALQNISTKKIKRLYGFYN